MESAIPPHLTATRTRHRRVPDDYKPPYPSFVARHRPKVEKVVMAYFGTQINPSVESADNAQIREFFAGPDAPANIESATYTDRAGFRTLLSSAYWTDPARYESWQGSSGFTAWWNDLARLRDRQGYFREILSVSPDRFETIFTRSCLVGVANTGGCPVVGPIREHNYWGAMRDRILARQPREELKLMMPQVENGPSEPKRFRSSGK